MIPVSSGVAAESLFTTATANTFSPAIRWPAPTRSVKVRHSDVVVVAVEVEVPVTSPFTFARCTS